MKKDLRLELAKDDLYVLEKEYKEHPNEDLKKDIKNTKKEIKYLEDN